jgi:hypothetical protein
VHTTPRTASAASISASASASASAAGSGVPPLNRRLALRLFLILGTTFTIWFLLFIVDISAWTHHRRGNRDTGLLVMVTLRSALARSVGLCDAVILGVDAHVLALCTWCGLCRWYRGRRPSSGGGGKSGGTFSGEVEEELEEDGAMPAFARTPTTSFNGAEPASFLARPVMLRHRSNSAGSLRGSGGSSRSLALLGTLSGGSSASLSQLLPPPSPEEEANAAVRAAEALRCARTPPLRGKKLKVFTATWNMGG